MECLGLEALLRYIEADSSQGEAVEIRRHMEQCGRCRQEVGAIQALVTNLGKLPWPEGRESGTDAGCVETVTLAAYIDQRLAGPERERVERHFANCQTCLDELITAVQRLATTAEAPQPVPAHLIEQAVALEAAGKPMTSPRWRTLTHQLREWVTWLAPPPQWVWGGSSVAVIMMLALYFGLSPFRERTGPMVQTDPGRQSSGYGFGTSAEVLRHGGVRLSPALRSALVVYQAHPTSAARDTLLGLLDKEPLGIPVDQVLTIEIKPSLRTILASAPETRQTVQVTLLQDGLLVIEDVPLTERP